MHSIEIVSIPVSDQERAKEFYENKLGFRIVSDSYFEQRGMRLRWLQLRSSTRAQTSISLVTWFEQMPRGCVQGLVLKTKNIEKDHRTLSKRGVQLSPIYQTPLGKFSNFKDPDGNGWMLHQT